MIDLYLEQSPAVFKVAILLEECGMAYTPRHLSVSQGKQHTPEFRAISPNGKVPAIVDHAPAGGGDPLAMFESGAILVYLAEKAGRFLPTDVRARSQVLQWLFWQSSGLSPLSGQAIHFIRYAPEETRAYGQLRYLGEVRRHWDVLDKHLQGRDYISGEYSIADMGAFTWVNLFDRFNYTLDDYPDLKRWWASIEERPAVKRAYQSVADARDEPANLSMEDFQKHMFGAEAANAMAPLKSIRG